MRFKGRMELEHGLKQIDIAPLVDIVFLLLVFFMLTSSFVIQPAISVNLPKTVTSEVVKPDSVEIIITEKNLIYLNTMAVTMEALKARLLPLSRKNKGILIKADSHSALGTVAQVWDLARDLGFSQVSIATDQK